MGQLPSQPVTELIVKWKAGDQEALHLLVPLVYKELHAVAHHHLQGERAGHTLQSTALVHEAYLRLVDQSSIETKNRAHFFAVASRLMRQILVDYARSRGAAKRGGNCYVELDEDFAVASSKKKTADVVALDAALTELSKKDTLQSQIVELRCFGGLTVKQVAEFLGISVPSVKRDWSMAKAWIYREMRRGNSGKIGAVGKD
jgi:RNA polymerase sigma factor (TIGR02999 family)